MVNTRQNNVETESNKDMPAKSQELEPGNEATLPVRDMSLFGTVTHFNLCV